MNKILFLTLMLFTSVFANEDTLAYCNGCKKKEKACECPKKACNACSASPCCCVKPCDFVPPCPPTECAYNAPTSIDLKCSWDVFLTGSYIYFEAKQDDMDLGSIITNETGTNPQTTISNNLIPMEWNYKSGFKVGLGYNFCRDCWDIYAEYMWYHNTPGCAFQNAEGVTSDGTNIIPSWMSFSSPFPPVNFATSSWGVDMDKLDVQLRRSYFVGKHLTFNPGVGLRALWLDQTYNARYDSDASDRRITSNNSICSWAVGPMAKINTDWNLCYGFRIFADIATSLLYTNYDLKSDQQSVEISDPNQIVTKFTSKNDDLCFLRPQAEFALGLGWGDYLCCNSFYFDLMLGYEFHVLWEQNVFYKVEVPTSINMLRSGNLYLQGLAVTLRLDF